MIRRRPYAVLVRSDDLHTGCRPLLIQGGLTGHTPQGSRQDWVSGWTALIATTDSPDSHSIHRARYSLASNSESAARTCVSDMKLPQLCKATNQLTTRVANEASCNSAMRRRANGVPSVVSA